MCKYHNFFDNFSKRKDVHIDIFYIFMTSYFKIPLSIIFH